MAFRVVLFAFGSRWTLRLMWWFLQDDIWADKSIRATMITWRRYWRVLREERWEFGRLTGRLRNHVLGGTMAIRRRTLESLFCFELLISFIGVEELRFSKSLLLISDRNW